MVGGARGFASGPKGCTEAARAVFASTHRNRPYMPASRPRMDASCFISKVIDGDSVDPQLRKVLAKQLDPLAGQESLAARMSDLKQKADIKIDEKKIEKPS
jgi:hypothetical protein